MNSVRLERLFEFLKDDPNDPFTIYAIALEYFNEEPLKALEYFNLLLNNHEEYTSTYYHAGKLHEKLGNAEEAAKIYQKGIEICRKKREMHALSELQSALNLLTDQEDEDEW
jgi:tetratricopeptide (TPR) repeat protein